MYYKTFKLKWMERWLKRAHEISSWSKDPSTKVGAVLVDLETNRQIGEGYNGFPPLIPDKKDWLNTREIKYKYVVHAERNALDFSVKRTDNMAMFITHPPCSQCFSQMIGWGVRYIFFPKVEDKSFRERWHTDEVIQMASEIPEITVEEILWRKEA